MDKYVETVLEVREEMTTILSKEYESEVNVDPENNM